MNKAIIMMSLYVSTLFFGSVIIHEMGHYIPANLFGCNPKFKFINGSPNMTTDGCNSNKELIIGISGIFSGLVWLLLIIRYFRCDEYIRASYLMLINVSILVGYIASCFPDMVRIIKIFNGL